MQRAINQNVLAADSLKFAIRQAGAIQNAKTELARTVTRDTKISFMEEYIRQSSGCSANEELSRACRQNILVNGFLHQGPVGEALNEALNGVIEDVVLCR
ncbi:hypothetical protein E4U61_007645 [Claviceps capensis]|nr:hypothetical protein E4U61_007645 [Claviceps capensis]